MSTELKAVISIWVAIIGVGITLAGLMLTTQHSLREEMQTLRAETQADFKAVRAEMQAEFKTQREITTNLLERVAHVEGLLEGLREAFNGRRIEAVAEDPEEYDPR